MITPERQGVCAVCAKSGLTKSMEPPGCESTYYLGEQPLGSCHTGVGRHTKCEGPQKVTWKAVVCTLLAEHEHKLGHYRTVQSATAGLLPTP